MLEQELVRIDAPAAEVGVVASRRNSVRAVAGVLPGLTLKEVNGLLTKLEVPEVILDVAGREPVVAGVKHHHRMVDAVQPLWSTW